MNRLRKLWRRIHPNGAWVAFYSYTESSVIIFRREIDALRFAQPMSIPVKFAEFGDEDWQRR